MTGTGRTRVAGALVFVVTVTALVSVVGSFDGLVVPVALGSGGAVLLAAAVGLARAVDSAAGGAGAGLLVVTGGIGTVGGLLTATLLLVERTFPVEETALLSTGWLTVLGHVGVVVGCSVAALGVAIAARNVVDDNGLDRGMRVVLAVAAVPTVTAVFFVLVALSGPTPDSALVAPVAGPVTTLFGPVAALLPGWVQVAVALAVAYPVLTLLADTLRSVVGSGRTAGGLAAGVLVTGTAIAVAGSAYDWVVSETLGRLPEGIAGNAEELSTNTVTAVGESTVALLAVVLCIGIAALVLLVVYGCLRVGALSTDAAGPSLASAGTFLAVVFGATVDAPAWLVVGGVAASLLVWDAGRFGTTLADEVGTRGTGRVELVHLGGTALVGVAGIAGAVVVATQFPTGGVTASSTDLVALSSVVVGLLALVFALR